jgi:hypothetical protein
MNIDTTTVILMFAQLVLREAGVKTSLGSVWGPANPMGLWQVEVLRGVKFSCSEWSRLMRSAATPTCYCSVRSLWRDSSGKSGGVP